MDIDIYLITLDRDEDRRQIFFENLPSCFKREDIKIFPAVDGYSVDIPDWFKIVDNLKARYGCYKSHSNLLKFITKPTLILEDDAVFTNDFCDKFYDTLDKIENLDYDIFYFGGKSISPMVNTTIDQHIKKSAGTYFTHAYFLKNVQKAKRLSKLIDSKYIWSENLRNSYEIDVLFARLQQRDIIHCYCYSPWLVNQNKIFLSRTKNQDY